MIIPPQKIQQQLQNDKQSEHPVVLESSHIVLNKDIVKELFYEQANVNVVYYESRNSLLIASSDDENFKKMHKAKQYMLKQKSSKGDASIAFHGLLIDHEIHNNKGPLKFEVQKALNLLKIEL